MGFFGKSFGNKVGYFMDAVNPLSEDFLENPNETQERDQEEEERRRERRRERGQQ